MKKKNKKEIKYKNYNYICRQCVMWIIDTPWTEKNNIKIRVLLTLRDTIFFSLYYFIQYMRIANSFMSQFNQAINIYVLFFCYSYSLSFNISRRQRLHTQYAWKKKGNRKNNNIIINSSWNTSLKVWIMIYFYPINGDINWITT